MLGQIEATLERFRIHFDSWGLQSELEQRLSDYLPRLDTYEKDGAVWARSSAYGDEDDRVLIRSEGGAPTYRAADVVYLADKLDRGFSTGRCTSSAPITTAPATGTRPSHGCSATTPTASRCCSTSSST